MPTAAAAAAGVSGCGYSRRGVGRVQRCVEACSMNMYGDVKYHKSLTGEASRQPHDGEQRRLTGRAHTGRVIDWVGHRLGGKGEQRITKE